MQTSPLDLSIESLPPLPDRGQRAPLIVFSHLRWGFVFQRPQHVLSRLARRFDIYFIEEPERAEGVPRLSSSTQQGGVRVLTPRTSVAAPGFHDDQLAVLKPLVEEFIAENRLAEPIVWLYTPMALPLIADLNARAIVYDCMDDLVSFKFAPPELVAREAALMAQADVVFTGGPSLHESRRGRNPNLHCLPSAVDAEHFFPTHLDASSAEGLAAAELHRGMPRPRLGFFGVIDERLDLELLAGIADQRPGWHIVMVGPVVKIDPATLPQRPNILWAGMQRYEALAHMMSHWDVCLLPFALNEATRFISPTKTLEYLAGGKPVVSTPIRDVVSLYGASVHVAATPEEFVAAAETALGRTPLELAAWRARAQGLVEACTWDGTADAMAKLLLPHAETARSQAIVLSGPRSTSRSRISGAEATAPSLDRGVRPTRLPRFAASRPPSR